MKKIIYLIILVAFTFIYSKSSAQLVVKKFSIADSKIGGECKLLTSTIDVKGDIASKTFEVDVIESGNYYLNVLQNYCSKRIKVKVDEATVGDVESTKKEGLDVYYISKSSNNGGVLKLIKGKHQIKFEIDDKLIPQIDYISLSKEALKSNFDLTKVKNELTELKSKNLKNYSKEDAKKALLALSSAVPQKVGLIATSFPKSYDYSIDVGFKYTYRAIFIFEAGQNIVLETYNSNCDPVMELVSVDCQHTWVNDDFNGYESRIEVNIPVSGIYYLRVRPYWSNAIGVSNIKLNSTIYATNIPIQWSYVNTINQTADGIERNYFTSKHNGEDLYSYDTFMWIEDDITLPGKIRAINDDYYSETGDFSWAYMSRIKRSFPVNIRNVWVNAYSQYSQSTCDVYVKAPNASSFLSDSFKNLKPDDAIQSAPFDNNYKCASWAGGFYSHVEWPCYPPSSYCNMSTYDSTTYIQHDELKCMDNFFGNWDSNNNATLNRYDSATTYYRTDNDNSDVEIDLWGRSTGIFCHVSVRKLANEHPHGYAWESKIGMYERIFHPREALNGGYGQILHHYAPLSSPNRVKSSIKTLEESVNLGLSSIDKDQFSESEKLSIKEFKTKLDKQTLTVFNDKFDKWKETWTNPEIAIYSNPQKFTESKEYADLLAFCKSKEKVTFPLIAEKLDNGYFLTYMLLMQVTLNGNMNLLNEVFLDNQINPRDENNAILVRSPYSNSIKFARKLLAKEKIIDEIPKNPLMLTVAAKSPENKLQIKITTDSNSKVKIEVYDVTGKFCKLITSDYNCVKGINTYYADISDLNNGIYLCKISGTYQKTAKFSVRK